MKYIHSLINSLVHFFFSYRNVLNLILRRPLATILFVISITIFFSWHIPDLSFKTSINDLIIDDLPETYQYKKFKEVFGSNEIIRVVIKCNNIFEISTFAKIDRLAKTAAKIKGIQRVVSLPGIKKSIDLTNKWSLEEFSKIIAGVDLFKKNLLSDDFKTTVLTLVLTNDVDQESVIHDVEDMIAKADRDLALYQIGMPLVSSALVKFTQKDFYRLPFITFILMAIILLMLYRKIGYFILPILCITFTLIWTFGLMAIIGIPLSMLTMIIPVFLIAVGTAYCLHIISEYLSILHPSKTPKEAVEQTFAKVTFPTVIAAFTTIVGLGSLLVNRISGIREFSIASCIGILSFVIILLTLLPSVMSFLPVPTETNPRKSKSHDFTYRLIEWIIQLNLRHQKVVLPVIGLLSIICIFGVFQLRVETNPMGYFKKETQISRNFHDIYKNLSGSFPINVVMKSKTEDFFEKPKNVASITKLQKFIDTLPGVDKTISFADYMKLVNYATNGFEQKYYILPEEPYEVRMLINSYKTMLGRDMLTPFMNTDFSDTNILLLTHISSSKEFLDTRKKIFEFVQKNFSKNLEWDISGFGIVISASSHHLTRGQIKSLGLTLIMVFGIMFALFLSFKVGLVTIVPNIFPIIVNFGIMGWLGIELSMATSLIASIAIGLAVDDTIHYLVRYNREFRKDLDDRRALRETLRHIGRPIIFTTITISIGFSILIFSSFKPTAVFGAMMMITMLSALVGDLILLPSMILHVDLVTVWDLVRLKLGMEPRFGIPLFQGLSRIQVYYILMAGALKKINAGEILFNKADQSDSMFAVISGRLDVFDHDVSVTGTLKTHAMRKLLAELTKGDIVGEMGLLRSAPRSATVIAAETSELLYINWKMIKRLHWLSPNAAIKFNANLLTIICDRMDRVTKDLYNTSIVDDLTGLINRKGFMRILEMETVRLKRYGSSYALCLFKITFNNPTVHPIMDYQNKILRDISHAISSETRKSNILGRISFQTFAFLIPRNSLQDARNAAQRLCRMLDHKNITGKNVKIKTFFALSDQLHESDTKGEILLEKIEGEHFKE